MKKTPEFAVIFDMDGVIIDNMDYHDRAYFELARRYNKKLTHTGLEKNVHGRTNMEANRFLFGDVSDERSKEITKEKQEIYLDIYKTNVRLLDGLATFLQECHDGHIPVGLATSATPNMAEFVFRETGIGKFFDATVTAHDISNSKPDPEIYLEAAKQLRMQPASCLVFEDSFSGIEAGKAAGMKVVGVATTHPEDKIQNVDHVITDFMEMTLKKARELME
ncbi:HAD family hydrolase [Patescibacteria group bacterium]